MLGTFLSANRRASDRIRRFLKSHGGRELGQDHFRQEILPNVLSPGMRVLDVGGGKHPAIDPVTKKHLDLEVVGLDVSSTELAQAPVGAYDDVIVGDVASVELPARAFDLVLSVTVLEHVRDVPSAVQCMSQAVAPGGVMAHLLPCANAGFAMVNRALGNRMGRRVLFSVFPELRHDCGFPAYYHRCTPRELGKLCHEAGTSEVTIIPYFASEYASFFLPAYLLEVSRQLLLRRLGLTQYAEMFTIIARKPAGQLN